MIAAGFGFRGAAGVDSLCNAFEKTAPPQDVAVIATVADKAASPVFHATSQRLALPVAPISAELMARQTPQTQSPNSRAARATGSVAEAAALAAAGPGARLLGPRVISDDKMATCALAVSETP